MVNLVTLTVSALFFNQISYGLEIHNGEKCDYNAGCINAGTALGFLTASAKNVSAAHSRSTKVATNNRNNKNKQHDKSYFWIGVSERS